MGCTFAHPRPRGEDTPHLFKVLNVDRDGVERNPGKIEITDFELVFHQKNKDPVQWPLRSLRRYGFDAELFSFESGRRCPTGPGIYAFKCSRAEALFNLLQECIQRAGQQDDTSPRPGGLVIDVTQRPMSVADLHPSADPTPRPATPLAAQAPSHNGGAGHTNGVVTLQCFPQISNNGHEYVNADTHFNGPAIDSVSASNIAIDLSRQVSLQSEPSPQIQYAELDLGQGAGTSQPVLTNGDSSQAMYMNLPANVEKSGPSLNSSVPLVVAPLPPVLEEDDTAVNENTANYSNFDIIATPDVDTKPKMMYIEVDFKNSDPNSSVPSGRGFVNGQINCDRVNESSGVGQSTPTTEGYAVIDFNKTAAINAKNTNHLEEEGTRKTRHNSSIDF